MLSVLYAIANPSVRPSVCLSVTRCEIRQRLLLITNRKSYTRFRLVPKSTTFGPWLTLKWPWTAIMHSVALHTCVWEPTTKICMKIDPYYQRQKCSPGILVSSKISFMQIYAGVRWRLERGRQMRVGWSWSKMEIFASFARYILRIFTSEATFIILCYVAH